MLSFTLLGEVLGLFPNVSTLMGVGLSHLPISYVVFLSPLGKISVCLSGSFISFAVPT